MRMCLENVVFSFSLVPFSLFLNKSFISSYLISLHMNAAPYCNRKICHFQPVNWYKIEIYKFRLEWWHIHNSPLCLLCFVIFEGRNCHSSIQVSDCFWPENSIGAINRDVTHQISLIGVQWSIIFYGKPQFSMILVYLCS